MPALMVQGCTSSAGKSWLVTALCRWFARQGVRVAPYKAQNMSNNARVLPGGGEIGVAQWLQARAAGVAPASRMNPILIKPEGDTGSQVVRKGRVDRELSALPWRRRSEHLWPTARTALDGLLAEYELVLMEGAGSPAETNLAAQDLANMRAAAHAGAPVLLTVDIDRGGAFAHLYGTWSLVGDEHRHRIAGFVLNRFRGDAALLPPAPDDLEALTGVPTVGVVPVVDHDLPDEDGATLHHAPAHRGRPTVAVVRYPTASNLDEFTRLEQVADLRWATAPRDLADAELIVLPGSKHVVADLAWMRGTGLARAVSVAAAAGERVIGVCGGLQMLGRALVGKPGIEGSGQGLGLLAVTTRFCPDKRAVERRARFAAALPDDWSRLVGRAVSGYEIRHGVTTAESDAAVEVIADGLGWASDNVLGVYLHGLFEDPHVLDALLGASPTRTLDATFERLADVIEQHLDTDLLLGLALGQRGA